MPARKKIEKENIIDTCLKITRREGIDALNARKVAKALGCSTQPLFYYYENMDEIKNEVLQEISKLFNQALLKSNYDRPAYKDIGVNYIRFASNEPEFFKIMFQSKMNKEMFDFIDLTGSSLQIFETISKQTGLSLENAKQFHLRMWLYVNGIASLAAHQTIEFSDDEIDYLLKEQYMSLLIYEVKKGNVKEEILVQLIKKNREGKE
ncbi:TetR/AcrR family transcriptional regulator [Faecalibacillus intestinalis]|uniref:TetR/AcrR family transcriptional regulator n=1 Tax=Faecalibacillus intestinalis TaxID=1982626 RepID=UPI0022E11F31|nr:TetR/AcrR family transcriptional regulator [Faecalibacillus intestinalis]